MRKVICATVAGLLVGLAGCGDDRKNSIPTVDKNATPPKLNAAGSGGEGGGGKKAPPAGTASEK